MNIIAWAYMVELEDGISKTQIGNLMKEIEEDIELFPFSLEDGNVELEANSTAFGFLDNDFYEDVEMVKEALAVVCNDWENEREDGLYEVELEDGEIYYIKMLCDFETVILD